MIIDFNKIPEERKPGFNGEKGELCAKVYAGELNKIMYDRLEPGSSIGYHVHETNSEIIYILAGKADFIYDDGTETVEAGGCHYCPKGHGHSMINNGTDDIVFFAVVPEQ